jgi:hypothetical protein
VRSSHECAALRRHLSALGTVLHDVAQHAVARAAHGEALRLVGKRAGEAT